MNKLIEKIVNKVEMEILGKPTPQEFNNGINTAIRIIYEEAKAYNEVKTNADYIRSLSDEELAWEFQNFRIDAYGKAKGDESVLPDSQKKILDWLKAEREG